jgi:hypothetical protein
MPLECANYDSRRLKVQCLALDPNYGGPAAGWELERGFRARVDSHLRLRLFLSLSPNHGGPDRDLLSPTQLQGEEIFDLIVVPNGLSSSACLEELKSLEPSGQVVLFMCDRSLAISHKRRLQRSISAPGLGGVFWVSLEMPTQLYQGVEFFNLEQNLLHFGRIGRHVARLVKAKPWIDRVGLSWLL